MAPMSTAPASPAAPAAPALSALKALQRDLAALLDATADEATAAGRHDLADRVRRAARRHGDRELKVLVVGEFKQGKSTLVNALLNATVCGVADDVSTVVPTLVRHGAELGATVEYHDENATPTVVGLDEARALGTEQGNPGNRNGIRSIEVTVPRKLLEPGLVIVDTPGVGGLESTHGAATTAALSMAEAVLFVSDVSQALTESEMEFLRTARSRCPNVVLVQTKTDIHPDWRRIVDTNTKVVGDLEPPIEVVAVSSPVRQAALTQNSTELNDESGYPRLLTFLRDAATGEASKLAVRTTVGDVDFVLDQLRSTADAERSVLADPESSAALVEQLERARQQAEQLRGQFAKWQQTLGDGIQDLISDLDHDLRTRIRAIVAECDEALDKGDPMAIWDDFEQWLHYRIGCDLSTHYQVMGRRADQLTEEVARHFAADEAALGVRVDVNVQSVNSRLVGEQLDLESLQGGSALAAVRGSYSGLLMFGMLGQMLGLALLNPLSIFVGLGLGRKSVRDEKKRQLMQRQQQAKMAARKYLDDINVEASKLSRDATRQIHRELRDEFSSRAEQLQATIRDSTRAAEAATKQEVAERQRQLAEVTKKLEQLAVLKRRAQAVSASVGGRRS
jgi:GTPase SAR1 family protein